LFFHQFGIFLSFWLFVQFGTWIQSNSSSGAKEDSIGRRVNQTSTKLARSKLIWLAFCPGPQSVSCTLNCDFQQPNFYPFCFVQYFCFFGLDTRQFREPSPRLLFRPQDAGTLVLVGSSSLTSPREICATPIAILFHPKASICNNYRAATRQPCRCLLHHPQSPPPAPCFHSTLRECCKL